MASLLDTRWWHAQIFLGLKLLRHYALKLWPWAPRFGLARFQENYVVEGLPPATSAFRLMAHEPGRCTACGTCDAVCPLLLPSGGQARAEDFLGPMGFILAGARAAPQLGDLRATLDALNGPGCQACRACDRACPEQIPIARLAAALEEQRVVVERARGGQLPITDASTALPPWVGRG